MHIVVLVVALLALVSQRSKAVKLEDENLRLTREVEEYRCMVSDLKEIRERDVRNSQKKLANEIFKKFDSVRQFVSGSGMELFEEFLLGKIKEYE